MAKKITDETLKFNIVVNGNQGQKEFNKLERANKKLAASNSELDKELRKLNRSKKKNAQAIEEVTKKLEENKRKMDANETQMASLREEIGLNKLTMSQLRKEARKLQKQLDQAEPETKEWKEYNDQLVAVKDRMGELRKESANVDQAVSSQAVSFDAIKDSANQYWQALMSGDKEGIKASFAGIRSGINGVTKAGLSFIATPIGAAITALVGVGLAAKAWFDFNVELEKANKLTQQITGLTGNALDAARIRATAIEETLGLPFKENIETAQSLVNAFQISYDEAFDIIENGAIRGGAANDEFLDSLGEYGPLFAKAGYSAQDFQKIVNAGIDLGIYQDKLPDAIKEFQLAITEGAQTAKDAMVNAFGKEFSDKIFKGIKDGSLKPKEALNLIAAEAERIGLNAQQSQQLTADLFKGAGEDAGGAEKIFKAVNKALNEQQRELTEIEKLNKEQLESNKQLNGLYTTLFKSSDALFSNLVAKGKLFGTKVLIKILEAGVGVYNWFVDLNNESKIFSAGLAVVGKITSTQFKIVGEVLSLAWEQFKTFGDLIEGIFTFDVSKISSAFEKGFSNMADSFTNLKNQAVSDFEDIQAAANGEVKMKRLTVEDLVADESETPTPDLEVTNNNSSELTAKDQKILDSRKALAQKIQELMNDQQFQDALNMRVKKSDDKTEQSKDNYEAELEEIRNKEIAKADMLAEMERLKNERLKQIQDEWLNQRKIEEEEKELTAKEEEYLKLEEEAYGDLEMLAELEELKESELQAIRDKWAEHRLQKSKEEQDKLKAEDLKFKEDLAAAEEVLQQAKADAANAGIGILKSFAKEGSALYKTLFLAEKAFAAGQILIKLPEEIAKISATYASIPGGQAIAAPLITAAKIRAGIGLATIAASTVQGFEEGLYGDKVNVTRTDGRKFNARYGGSTKTGVVTEPTYFRDYITGEAGPELIVDSDTFKNLDPNVIDHIYSTRNRVKGFEEGKYPEPSDNEPNNSSDSLSPELLIALISAVDRLSDKLDKPIPVHFPDPYEAAENIGKHNQETEESNQNGTLAQ